MRKTHAEAAARGYPRRACDSPRLSRTRRTPQLLGVPSSSIPGRWQDRFGFRSEIKCVLRLVIVDPVHAIAIVEKHRGSGSDPRGAREIGRSILPEMRDLLRKGGRDKRAVVRSNSCPRSFRRWAVSGGGNSSPEKTSSTSPRSFRRGIPWRRSPLGGPTRRKRPRLSAPQCLRCRRSRGEAPPPFADSFCLRTLARRAALCSLQFLAWGVLWLVFEHQNLNRCEFGSVYISQKK